MANQNQLSKPVFPEFSPEAQQWMSQLADTVNSLAGFNGVIKLNNHVDLGGSQLKNVGAPTAPTDALTSGLAEASYSASVLAPKLESTGSQPLKTVRRLSDPNQREGVSSFLNDLMSTPPNANAIIPLTSNVSGGVQIVIPSSPFTFADGSTLLLQSRTDTILSLPTSYSISSISCVGNLVTLQTTVPTGLTIGQVMTVTGVSPVGFNGAYPITGTAIGNTLYYQDDLGTVGGSGGSVEINNVYYYAVKKRSTLVNLFGPFNGDTASNRLQVNQDGNQIVAVVVLTASGSQVASSGGGGSVIVGSPTAGVFF